MRKNKELNDFLDKYGRLISFVLVCMLVVVCLQIGHRIGYNQAFPIVNKYCEQYKKAYCMCAEPKGPVVSGEALAKSGYESTLIVNISKTIDCLPFH